MVKSLLISISFGTYIYRAAFWFQGFELIQKQEIFFDLVQLVDILLTFFTALERAEVPNAPQPKTLDLQDIEFVIDLRIIAKKYLSGWFITDVLACIPGLVTQELN